MTYSDFGLWRAACLSHGLIPVQKQGWHRFEFLNHQGTPVAVWDGSRDVGDGPELLAAKVEPETPPAAA